MNRLLPLLILTGGCVSQLTGNEGNFQFRYPADDRVLDFNKPVAVGGLLDLEVVDVGSLLPVEILSASFDDPMVLDVNDFAASRITIAGKGDGNALLSVEGVTAAGEELPDSVNLNARVPEVHRINHTCGPTGSREQGYLVGQRVYVPYEFEMNNGQPVVGYGYHPVALSGPLATIDASYTGQQHLALDTVAEGPLVVTSDIDGTTLEMALVTSAAIDGAEQPIGFVLEDIDVGDKNAFYVLPTALGLALCQADVAFDVQSDTPTTCAVRKLGQRPLDDQHEYGWFEVEGLAAGECAYTVTYPEGNGGAGASGSFTFPIEP